LEELRRLKQRALGLKSQAQALKGQYNALEKQRRNLEAENARLEARYPQIIKRLSQLQREIDDKFLQEYGSMRVDQLMISDIELITAIKWRNELRVEQRSNAARRQAIPSEVAGIEQQKKNIKEEVKQLKEQYNRVVVEYINLNNRLAARNQRVIPGRGTAPPPGIQIPGRTTAPPPGPGMPGHSHPDGSRN